MTKSITFDQRINGLLTTDNSYSYSVLSWQKTNTLGTAISLTYSFASSRPDDSSPPNFLGMNTTQKQAVKNILDMISSYINVTFTETSDVDGDIQFGTASLGQVSTGLKGLTTTYRAGVDDEFHYIDHALVLLTNDDADFVESSAGSKGYFALIHEIGHALGLGHPFEGLEVPTGTDNWNNTVMSYTDDYNRFNDPLTIMNFDFIALEYLYGSKEEINPGDTYYNAIPPEGPLNYMGKQLLVDTGGIDTISYASAPSPVSGRYTIDLNTLLGTPWTLAENTEIENVIGSKYSDNIVGNNLDNKLEGGLGNNIISGGNGNDTLYFDGDAVDYIIGKPHFDFVIVTSSSRYKKPEYFDVGEFAYGRGTILKSNVSIEDYNYGNNVSSIVMDTSFTGIEYVQFSDSVFSVDKIASNTAPEITPFNVQNELLSGHGELKYNEWKTIKDLVYANNSVPFLDQDGDEITKYKVALNDVGLHSTAAFVDGIRSTGYFLERTIVDDLDDIWLFGSYNSQDSNGSIPLKMAYWDGTGGYDSTSFGISVFDGLKWSSEIWFTVYSNYITQSDFASLTGPVGKNKNGTEQDETLTGTPIDDVLNGNNGDDRIFGYSGNDTLNGNSGNDHLYGGRGSDTVVIDVSSVDTVVTRQRIATTATDGLRIVSTEGTDFVADDVEYFQFTDGVFSYAEMLSGANSAPTGDVEITGTATSGQTLTADTSALADADGLGAFSYQWLRDGSDISGATTSNYALSQSDVGSEISVRISYTDAGGVGESMTSAAAQVSDPFEGTGGDDTINGDSNPNTINGLAGNDRLDGGDGNDTLLGGDGNDILLGRAGNDVLNGGEGTDRLYGGYGDDQLFGGAGDDQIKGGSDNDKLYGGLGNDSLNGESGNDRLYGDEGNDSLRGEDGDDVLLGRTGNDLLAGNAGNDRLYGGFGNDRLYGGTGNDRMNGGSDNDLLRGGLGDDELNGDGGDDDMNGEDGNDSLSGGDGADRIEGGRGDDVLRGDAGNDLLLGRSGADVLAGGAGDDRFYGGSSADKLYGGAGDDDMNGGSGDDFMRGGLDDDTLRGNNGDDDMNGEAGNDRLSGGDGADRIEGGRGNDSLRGEAGNDLLLGRSGVDVLSGGDGDDRFYGGSSADRLYGGNGDDQLNGGSGDDLLYGGAGSDSLKGNSGADTFVFKAVAGTDTVQDFEDGVDMIQFKDGDFADLTIVAAGGNVDITGANGGHFVLLNTDVTDITADDFVF